MNWINERWIDESELDSVRLSDFDVIGLSRLGGGDIALIYKGAIKDANRSNGAPAQRPLFVKVADFGEPAARERVRKALDPEGADVGWVTN